MSSWLKYAVGPTSNAEGRREESNFVVTHITTSLKFYLALAKLVKRFRRYVVKYLI